MIFKGAHFDIGWSWRCQGPFTPGDTATAGALCQEPGQQSTRQRLAHPVKCRGVRQLAVWRSAADLVRRRTRTERHNFRLRFRRLSRQSDPLRQMLPEWAGHGFQCFVEPITGHNIALRATPAARETRSIILIAVVLKLHYCEQSGVVTRADGAGEVTPRVARWSTSSALTPGLHTMAFTLRGYDANPPASVLEMRLGASSNVSNWAKSCHDCQRHVVARAVLRAGSSSGSRHGL